MLMDKSTREIEREIIDVLLTDLLAAGFRVSVDDGEALPVKKSTDKAKIMAELGSTGSDHLLVFDGGTCIGWFLLVYGNDGWNVISDYTTNLEQHHKRADALAEHYSNL